MAVDIGRIRDLEDRARALEPGIVERRALLADVDDHAQRWLERLPELPVYGTDDQDGIDALGGAPITEDPRSLQEILEVLGHGVDDVGVNESSGSFFGYIPGSGLYSGALADYHAAVVNRYGGVYYAAPGAVRVGRACIEWMADVLGYPTDCGGDITSGGSVANLSAVVTARDACGLRSQDYARSVIYLSAQTHHAVDKAIRIAGLGDAQRRLVPLDAGYRMRADELARLVDTDRRAGLRPFLVVASAGVTDTGAVDPLDAIADVCAQRSLWFHVDAAYGGAFALTADGARRFEGIARSDSVVVDPHKGLFLPFGTGVVLVRNREHMARAFSGSAAYIEDAMASEPDVVVSPSELSPELTRPFRALRWWMSLQLAGVGAFRAALEEKLLLTRHAYERIGALDGFEVGPEPDLTIFTFRHVANGDPDAVNRALVDAIRADGRIYVSATVLDDRYTLRFAVLNCRTHLDQVDRAVDVIAELAAQVAAG